MTSIFKTIFYSSILIIVSSTVSQATETQWGKNHPRREQVNQRINHQNKRINRELKEGDITRQQAKALHREDTAIRQEERDMAKQDNGHITKLEQKTLNQQLNINSKAIGH